jgi:hypothetical protein
MMELTQRDLNFIIRNLPADIRKLLKSTPGFILGGGFIRGVIAGESISNIDVFGPDTVSFAGSPPASPRHPEIVPPCPDRSLRQPPQTISRPPQERNNLIIVAAGNMLIGPYKSPYRRHTLLDTQSWNDLPAAFVPWVG